MSDRCTECGSEESVDDLYRTSFGTFCSHDCCRKAQKRGYELEPCAYCAREAKRFFGEPVAYCNAECKGALRRVEGPVTYAIDGTCAETGVLARNVRIGGHGIEARAPEPHPGGEDASVAAATVRIPDVPLPSLPRIPIPIGLPTLGTKPHGPITGCIRIGQRWERDGRFYDVVDVEEQLHRGPYGLLEVTLRADDGERVSVSLDMHHTLVLERKMLNGYAYVDGPTVPQTPAEQYSEVCALMAKRVPAGIHPTRWAAALSAAIEVVLSEGPTHRETTAVRYVAKMLEAALLQYERARGQL